MRRFILLTLGLAVLLSPPSIEARSKKRSRPAANTPGKFDYYLLSLSWSPEFCAGPNGADANQQCGSGRRFGFVVHGLWPQNEQGYPESCGPASRVPSSIVNSMLPLMPSPKLIQHEWEHHGTCSGFGVTEYFQLVQKAFATVRIPDDFKAPIRQVEVPPATIKSKFLSANPTFPPDAIKVQCSARYLSEVRVCLTRDLKGRRCSNDVRDTCRADTIVMRPLR